MQTAMQATTNATRIPTARPRAGWIVGGLAALFLLLDGASNALRQNWDDGCCRQALRTAGNWPG